MSGRFALLILLAVNAAAFDPPSKPQFSAQEKPIADGIRGLRKLPDSERGNATKSLALQIRALPPSKNKLRLASGLASLATEGDFGREPLQEVATTLAEAVREQPPSPGEHGEPAGPYVELAQLARYEHVQTTLKSPQLTAAMAKLEADDRARDTADFTLTDLSGKSWTLKQLSGKVVLVNFWATWCPPCRKEMPDLDALGKQFADRGLVILAISDEDTSKVNEFLAAHPVSYPILLDPGRKVNDLFRVEGIPKTFIFDRNGHLAAQSIDMRTRKQFLDLLSKAGIVE